MGKEEEECEDWEKRRKGRGEEEDKIRRRG